jgi:hypothetical protein
LLGPAGRRRVAEVAAGEEVIHKRPPPTEVEHRDLFCRLYWENTRGFFDVKGAVVPTAVSVFRCEIS